MESKNDARFGRGDNEGNDRKDDRDPVVGNGSDAESPRVADDERKRDELIAAEKARLEEARREQERLELEALDAETERLFRGIGATNELRAEIGKDAKGTYDGVVRTSEHYAYRDSEFEEYGHF